MRARRADARRGPATRQRILEAARELFARRGVERVTMRELAHAIRLTPAAIYLHFRDKAALLRELVEHDFRGFSARLARLTAVADPVERLREMGHAYIEFGLTHPNHYRLLLMTPHAPHVAGAAEKGAALGHGAPEQDAYAFLCATVQECIAAGRFRPEYQNPEQVAQVIWAALHGVVALHIAKGDDPWLTLQSPTRTVALLIETLHRGLAASPE